MLKKKIISFLFLSLFYITPVLAAEVELKDYIDPLNISSQSDSQVGIVNSVAFTVGTILDQVFGILGIVALCIIVYSGIIYIRSLGKNDKANKALKYMEWAAIGLVVIFFSYAVVKFVLSEIVKIGKG
ncbi:MAG TPA: hypothetical protein PLM63_02310 [bacterium]|nr:hypothetical protein [Patescibacteria group bacterium]HPO11389.1 hypothetical protein [bacterium]HQL11813.1 hypothetical protein [bacterium]